MASKRHVVFELHRLMKDLSVSLSKIKLLEHSTCHSELLKVDEPAGYHMVQAQ